jgi:hypothetical protein
MDPKILVIILAVVAALVIAAVLISVSKKRRSSRLKEHFGTEYDRTLQVRGNPTKAEHDLLDREKRVQSYKIKALSPEARTQFADEWSIVQGHFVEEPKKAVLEADSLCSRVMEMRGYPVADFDQRAADVSVTHPAFVADYRAARSIVERQGQGEVGTEDLRQAMVHYRSLFTELLETRTSAAA